MSSGLVPSPADDSHCSQPFCSLSLSRFLSFSHFLSLSPSDGPDLFLSVSSSVPVSSSALMHWVIYMKHQQRKHQMITDDDNDNNKKI